MSLSTRRALVALALGAAALAGTAAAQTYTKPVTIIVPYAPGGTSDILARLIGPKLSEVIGQPVIVENKPSSSGNVGADFVAKAPPDGATLLITDVGTLSTAPNLFKKLSFDLKDLTPVTMVMFSPYLFAVHPSVPASTPAELAAYDKANPGKLTVGSSGVGSANHLTAIVIGKHLGIGWTAIPFRGGSAAIRSVVSNESQAIFNGASATQPFVVQGQLKGLAVSGDKRLPALPNLPTFKELGFPVVDSGTWQAFLTSKGTPAATVDRLNADLRRVLAQPEIVAKIAELGGDVRTGTPAELAAWLDKSMREWGEVIREAKIQLD